MACPEITIEGIDGNLYNKLLGEATAGGARFLGYQALIDGLVFDWKYDSESQTLRILCTKKPFYMTCNLVETRIRKLIEKSKGSI